MRRNHRTLNDYGLQRNAGVGLFTRPSILSRYDFIWCRILYNFLTNKKSPPSDRMGHATGKLDGIGREKQFFNILAQGPVNIDFLIHGKNSSVVISGALILNRSLIYPLNMAQSRK